MDTQKRKSVLDSLLFVGINNLEEIFDSISEENEEQRLRKFYYKIIEKCERSFDFRVVAYSIIKYLGDKEWMKNVYQIAEEKAYLSNDYLNIAGSYLKYLQDKSRAKELCQNAANIAETCDDYVDLANFEAEHFEDTSNLAEYYKKAEPLACDDFDNLFNLGLSILKYTENDQKANDLISKCIENTNEVENLCVFYDELDCGDLKYSICDYQKYELLDEIKRKAKREACFFDEYLCLANYLDDDDIIDDAIDAADSADDYLAIADYLESQGDDPSAVLKQALEDLDQDDDEEIAKIKDAMK